MAQTRIDTYQIEPGTEGYVLTVQSGVATWAADTSPVSVASGDLVYNEVPTGVINGSNTAFTLANTPANNTVARLYLDGLRLLEGGGNDFTISGSAVTMLYAPATGQNFLADYLK